MNLFIVLYLGKRFKKITTDLIHKFYSLIENQMKQQRSSSKKIDFLLMYIKHVLVKNIMIYLTCISFFSQSFALLIDVNKLSKYQINKNVFEN